MDNENQNLINLVTDAQNDVDGAFDKLYHESFRHAYCTASLLLKNEQDIEDVLQNSYMYAAKYIKDLKNPESFNNWLGVIVKHECQKYIVKQKRVSDIFLAVKKTKEFELIDENNLPIDYIEKSEMRDAIQQIVDDLPQDKRACIVLFYYEQHSLSEISEILGVPEGTVMSRLYYARKKLEKEFKKLQKKDESLFGISVIPLMVSLLAYQAKTAIIPSAIESGVIAAVSLAEGTTVAASAASAVSAAGTTTAATGAASAGASTAAGTAVATKVAAVAVAASVAVGGGAVAVNHIKNTNETETTHAISTSLTEEHATVAAAVFDETTLIVTENTPSTEYISEVNSSDPKESKTSRNAASTKSTSTYFSTIKSETTKTSTTKPSTTKATTTSKPTTTKKATTESTTQKVTTTKETTTKRETTTSKVTTTAELTTNAADIFSVSDGVLSEYTGTESNVSIPSTVGSSTVTAIGTGAFAGNTDITSVSIPSTVTRIGMEAFSDCTNLRSVSLPSSLSSIGVAAFYGCSSLTSVTIPDGTQTISDEAFSYCTNLSSITIPDSVTSISEDAFYGSDNVTIRCSEGSAAQDYAVENSINYEFI